jgi:hypothetical protein
LLLTDMQSDLSTDIVQSHFPKHPPVEVGGRGVEC